MKTRRFEKRKTNHIVRICKHCRITNDDIAFLVQKDTRSGRFYAGNICKACYEDRRKSVRSRWYREHRESEIRKAAERNVANRERYNARRRKRQVKWWSKVGITYKQLMKGVSYTWQRQKKAGRRAASTEALAWGTGDGLYLRSPGPRSHDCRENECWHGSYAFVQPGAREGDF